MSAGNSRYGERVLRKDEAAPLEAKRTGILKRYEDMVRDKTISTESQADLSTLPPTLKGTEFKEFTPMRLVAPVEGAADALTGYLDQAADTTNILGKRERERLRRDEMTKLTTDSPTLRASRAGGFSLLTGRGQGPTLLT